MGQGTLTNSHNKLTTQRAQWAVERSLGIKSEKQTQERDQAPETFNQFIQPQWAKVTLEGVFG
jgi:hypothetical protein